MPYLVVLLVSLLAGCGQKGPLYLPATSPDRSGPPAEVLPSAPTGDSQPAATRPSDLPE